MGFSPMPSIRDIVKLYRLRAVKNLSQNFLYNSRMINKIVKQAGKIKDAHVVEVGPGPGGITRAILQKSPRKLSVIEKDRRFEPTLQMLSESCALQNIKLETFYNDVLLADMSYFLDKDLKKDWDDKCPDIQIIGNLPFNVATPLIIKWLSAISTQTNAWALGRVRMVLTFQKEVGERLVAPPGNAQRCRLSLMAQAWTEPKMCYVIPGYEFVPAPEVDVAIVRFVPLIEPRAKNDYALFEKVTRHMFSFPRKTAQKNLETLVPPEYHASLVPLIFKLAEVGHHRRVKSLTVEDVDRICSAYKYICEKHPNIKDYNYRSSKRILGDSYTEDIVIEDYEEEEEEEKEAEECYLGEQESVKQ